MLDRLPVRAMLVDAAWKSADAKEVARVASARELA
jgi:hypothetical protein